MAKVERISANSNLPRPTREQAELQIGLNNKTWYDSPITSMLNNPTVVSDWWSINPNETTFSETANLMQSKNDATRFNMIEGFVHYGRNSQELEDKPDTERRLSINLADGQTMILGGTIEPKEGDHFIPYSSKHIDVPFMVTKVTPANLINKEVWVVDYSESTVFKNRQDLIEHTVKWFVYKSENVGTGKSTIVDKSTDEKMTTIEKTMDNIQKMLVEAFYDKELDVYAFHSSLYGNYLFNYYANDMLQENHRLLKYGHNRNTLFFSNIYGFDRTTTNYKTSIYERMLCRDFKKLDETFPEPDDNRVTSGAGEILYQILDIRDQINEEYDAYTPKYSYNIKLYLRQKSNHMIFSTLYNTDYVLVDMLNTAGFIDPYLKSCYYTYEIRHPLLCKFFDAWMDNNMDLFQNYVKELDNYYVDKDNIDDYFGATLLLLLLKEHYGEISKDVFQPTYAKNFNRGGK